MNIYYDNTIIEKINTILNNFLSDNDFKDVTCELNKDFMYLPDKKIIYYAFTTVDSGMEWLDFISKLYSNSEYFENKFNLDYFDNFILSFFHELGHYATFDDCDESLYWSSQKAIEKINNGELSSEIYYFLPTEMNATIWACDFIFNNADKINKMWIEIKNLLMEFYKSINNKD